MIAISIIRDKKSGPCDGSDYKPESQWLCHVLVWWPGQVAGLCVLQPHLYSEDDIYTYLLSN